MRLIRNPLTVSIQLELKYQSKYLYFKAVADIKLLLSTFDLQQ